MMAGKMRLNTFLLLVCATAGAFACGGAAVYFFVVPPTRAPPPVAILAPAPAVTTAPAAPSLPAPSPVAAPVAAAPTGSTAPGAREVDTTVLSYKGKDIGGDKLKDVTAGKPYKLNVYQDAGKNTA